MTAGLTFVIADRGWLLCVQSKPLNSAFAWIAEAFFSRILSKTCVCYATTYGAFLLALLYAKTYALRSYGNVSETDLRSNSERTQKLT